MCARVTGSLVSVCLCGRMFMPFFLLFRVSVRLLLVYIDMKMLFFVFAVVMVGFEVLFDGTVLNSRCKQTTKYYIEHLAT